MILRWVNLSSKWDYLKICRKNLCCIILGYAKKNWGQLNWLKYLGWRKNHSAGVGSLYLEIQESKVRSVWNRHIGKFMYSLGTLGYHLPISNFSSKQWFFLHFQIAPVWFNDFFFSWIQWGFFYFFVQSISRIFHHFNDFFFSLFVRLISRIFREFNTFFWFLWKNEIFTLDHRKKISSSQLFSNFFSKTVTFTKFFTKNVWD